MSKRKKRLEKIRQNPKNVSFEELRKVLEDYGFELYRVKGSHHIFQVVLEDNKITYVVPYGRGPLQPVYVQDFVKLIDKYFSERPKRDDETDE